MDPVAGCRDAAGACRPAGQPRSPGAGCRGTSMAEETHVILRHARPSLRVQPWARHCAADATGPCGRFGGAGACGRRVAIVLFNLGGPDRPESIRPFLLNLFRDPAILRVPFFVRPFLARRIAARPARSCTGELRAAGRQVAVVGTDPGTGSGAGGRVAEMEARCFVAMRYWHPLSDEMRAPGEALGAGRTWFLLPLYPHFSTTTTGSSLRPGERLRLVSV